MQVDKYKNYTALDFLRDKDFLRWQLLNNKGDRQFWNHIANENPTLKPIIDEAVALYTENIRFNDYRMSQPEIYESLALLRDQIREQKRKKTRRVLLISSAVAASIIVILFLSLPYYKVDPMPDTSSDTSTFALSLSDNTDLYSSDTKLIVSENNIVVLDNEESSIQYEEDAIKADDNLILKEMSSSYNQLITPYGKRSVITFSDGTKAWVNAGSKLTYPAEFREEKREIYIDGEIYIEVSEDKKRPFVVKTKRMDINVLGTKFNVSAYETDEANNVVLASGSVRISSRTHEENVILKANQMYSDFAGTHSVENVDASIHTLWTQGIYQFESEKLVRIALRLERYYGVKISCDTAIASLKCSGKLDLKDNLNKLLTDLTRALPITFMQDSNGNYILKAKS